MRAQLKGEITEIKVLMSHPMETGDGALDRTESAAANARIAPRWRTPYSSAQTAVTIVAVMPDVTPIAIR